MAPGIDPVAAAWQANVQAVFVGMQHATDRAQILKRPVMHRCFSGSHGDAHTNRALAIELAVRAPIDLSEAIDAAGHDVVVRPAQ